MWATDLRFLNDRTEAGYGLDLASKALDVERNHAPVEHQHLLAMASDLLHHLIVGPNAERRFAVSLSGNGDLLSQWRAYGDSGAGYAVGFDVETLRELHGLECRPVTYGSDDAARRLRDVIREVTATVQPPDGDELDRQFDAAEELANRLNSESLFVKHPAFKEESELRLTTTSSAPRHRVRRDAIVSYVPIPISTLPQIPSLVEIVLGPLASDRAEMGLRDLLATNRYPDGEPLVRRSEIPFRP